MSHESTDSFVFYTAVKTLNLYFTSSDQWCSSAVGEQTLLR